MSRLPPVSFYRKYTNPRTGGNEARISTSGAPDQEPRLRGSGSQPPACILKDTRILMHVLMYPDASQTYLTNTITFEENMNTCILTLCIYFDMYPKESHRYIWDTCQIHQDTCILRASLVSPWIHIRIHQDTCILDCSSRYIRIHRDTKSRYMYLGRDTCGIQSEMHTSNVSREARI